MKRFKVGTYNWSRATDTSINFKEKVLLAAEAKALLQHTNWSVADIAYGLSFEYPTYFNNYYKRVTGIIPKSFRTSKV